MKKKTITVGRLLEKGLIKKATKVRLVTTTDLKKFRLIKLIKREKITLIAVEDLMKKGLIKKR